MNIKKLLEENINLKKELNTQHKTKPKKTTPWKIKKVKTPLFQAASCSYSKTFKYNFLKR